MLRKEFSLEKDWKIKDLDPKGQVELSEALGVHPIVAQVLINRGIGVEDLDFARQFLNSDLTQLHDPFLMKGMKEAVERVKQAQTKKEKVLVFGDYDVDGVTSSALLNRALDRLGVDVIHHIPHRMTDGYGLNHSVGEFAKDNGVSLILTIDCGISAVEEVKGIVALGIDVVIFDHHEPDEGNLPPAYAIVDPKQNDCNYPFKELASVGLAAKFNQALFGKLEEGILDLVAIGTVADIVPLQGENRIFVKQGLPLVQRTKNLGLRALLESAKVVGKTITPYYVGFILGPRINASGRMDSALTALDLFLAKDAAEAKRLAAELEGLNLDRQKMQKEVIAEATQIAEESFNEETDRVIVLSKEGWHKGVLGIVASRITEKFYRPSVVISVQEGVGTASCRSVDGFHLYDTLNSCSEYLEAFGGHEGAAGLTIKEEKIESFRAQINEVAERTLSTKRLKPVLTIESEIALSEINLALANVMEDLEPFGEANPMPIFCTRNLIVKGQPQVLGKGTLKFWVTEGKRAISVVGFGMANLAPKLKHGGQVDLAYQIAIDSWNKAPTPQLMLKDLKISKE